MAVAKTQGEEQTAEHKSIWRRIFSLDHKVIGKQYMLTALVMAAIGGILAMLMRLQLGWPDSGVIDPTSYYQYVTMHGTIMIFFFLTTILSGGFGNFLIPLQIGAKDMAFPWLNMISYWLYPPAIIVLLLSFVVDGGPSIAGWTAYPPLSLLEGQGQTLWLISLAILMVAFLLGGLNYITTILNMRAKGMSMTRLPLTTWSLFLTALVGLLSFPVLTAAAIMQLFDRLAGTGFFAPAAGGDPLLWQHLFWFFGHPEVYIVLLPAMGIVSDVITANARKPIFGYKFMVGSMMAISFMSYLVWGHHMFASGMSPVLGTVFMTTTLIIAIPSAIKTFNWLATLWRGKLHFSPQMLFSIGFVSLFVTGGLSGIFLAQPAVNVYLHDTYFVLAHFHFVMASASLFGVFAGIYHWFPKMFGRKMNERLGKTHFWITFVGIYCTFFPMHFLGIAGYMRRIYSPKLYSFLQPLEPIQTFISIAAFVLGAAQLIFIYNFFHSMALGERAGRNPWNATTLEWYAASPPVEHNWDEEVPTVYRWAYQYSPPGEDEDFVPQWIPPQSGGVAAADD